MLRPLVEDMIGQVARPGKVASRAKVFDEVARWVGQMQRALLPSFFFKKKTSRYRAAAAFFRGASLLANRHSGSVPKLACMLDLLTMKLVDIVSEWEIGSLRRRGLSKDECVVLVESLFSDTLLRRQAIDRILG